MRFYYIEKVIKADINVLKVRFDHIQPAITFTTSLVASSIVFFYRV